MADKTQNQQGSDKKEHSTIETKHKTDNAGGQKTEAGLPGQGQKGENERESS